MTNTEKPAKPILTPEEIKEKKREYMREYMRKRREEPEFAEKQRTLVKAIQAKLYNDETSDFRRKKKEYNVEYYQKLKEGYKEVRMSLKSQ